MTKNKKDKFKLSPTNIKKSIIAIPAWLLVWLSTQALFFFDIPLLSDYLSRLTLQQSFIVLTLWISIIASIVSLLWYKLYHNFSFLKAPAVIYLAYIIPLILVVKDLLQPQIFGINPFIWVLAMIITTFIQDILTFGYLQTYLEKQINLKPAAIATALIFYIGHFIGIGSIDITTALIYAFGFAIFAFLRYRSHSIYLTNALHLSFLLLVI